MCCVLSGGEHCSGRGGSPETLAVAPSSEAAPKQQETPSKGANGEDSSTVPTPGRSGKARQAINIKAELEKRQGAKTLLNLVVIGEAASRRVTTSSPSRSLPSAF